MHGSCQLYNYIALGKEEGTVYIYLYWSMYIFLCAWVLSALYIYIAQGKEEGTVYIYLFYVHGSCQLYIYIYI